MWPLPIVGGPFCQVTDTSRQSILGVWNFPFLGSEISHSQENSYPQLVNDWPLYSISSVQLLIVLASLVSITRFVQSKYIFQLLLFLFSFLVEKTKKQKKNNFIFRFSAKPKNKQCFLCCFPFWLCIASYVKNQCNHFMLLQPLLIIFIQLKPFSYFSRFRSLSHHSQCYWNICTVFLTICSRGISVDHRSKALT